MPRIELIYDVDCPNVPEARSQLARAFALLGEPPHWQEWRSDDPKLPRHVRGFGSPTILVDGQDVAVGAGKIDGTAGCRIYATAQGLCGVPSVEEIAAALRGDKGML